MKELDGDDVAHRGGYALSLWNNQVCRNWRFAGALDERFSRFVADP
jgi:hypothetical protein